MDSKKNLFTLMTTAQLDVLQSENSDAVILPLTEQQISEGQSIYEEFRKDDLFDILMSPDLENFTANLNDIKYHVSMFQEELEYTSIRLAEYSWLKQLQPSVQQKYFQHMELFFQCGILPAVFADGKEFTIGGLRHINHRTVIKQITTLSNTSEEEKETMITCYTSFIYYLDGISYGWFNRALLDLSKENDFTSGNQPQQKKIYLSEWRMFIDVLYGINQRDSIIARCLMGSPTRISEILNLTISQIDWDNNGIRLKQTKQNGIAKECLVPYNPLFIQELKEYIDLTTEQRGNSEFIFVTRNGKPVTRSRLNYSLAEASEQAKVSKVTPDSLKFIWSDLIQSGTKEEVIMQSKKWKFYKNI